MTTGYIAKWLPNINADDARSVAKHLRTAISDAPSPEAQQRLHLVRYIYRWREQLNNAADAARLDELEDIDFSLEEASNLQPKTHFRRQEYLRKVQKVPFEEYAWLKGDETHAPRVLGPVDVAGKDHFLLVLTDSHQLALAGDALHNCKTVC